MPIDYLLIDLENVTPGSISNLLENQTILIFTGSRQNTLSRDLVISMQPFGKQVKWIVIGGNGKNAADFHIAFYIGVYSEKEPSASFSILSKDTGFDTLIKHLVSRGIKCKRIVDINNFSKPIAIEKHNQSIDEIVSDLDTYFLKCNNKLRPKRFSKLIAFIKSRGKLDDDTVKAVTDKMISNKMIERIEDKVIYLVDDLPF